MEKLIFAFVLISGGLIIGYLLQIGARKNVLLSTSAIPALRKNLQKLGLLVFMPISFMSAIWVVSLDDARLIFFPIIGIIALASGGALALLASRILQSTKKQTGVLFCCGSFTNIGAIGGLVCYTFFGEAGFALVALYKMCEEVFYYTVGFPIAKYCAQNDSEQKSFLGRLIGVILDPFVLAALIAFTLGATLNLSGVVRPQFFSFLSALSVPLGTFVLLVSIGLGMRFGSVRGYMKESIAISFIKFIFVPTIACSAAYFFGFGNMMNGLPLKVVFIVSSMPVAFNALVAASIYDLDLDLANSCWLVTTASLLIVLPWLYIVSSMLL